MDEMTEVCLLHRKQQLQRQYTRDPKQASGASRARGQIWDLAISCAVHADHPSCVSVVCDMILGRLHIMPYTQCNDADDIIFYRQAACNAIQMQ